jgi:hypothetical protein
MPHNHTYADLPRLNAWIRKNSDTWYLHCTTRTVQESKLYPVPAYMMLSYFQAYYRFPELLRKIEASMPAEEIGDRMREIDSKGDIISHSCVPEFYLAGRQLLIDLGMLKPTDGLDDLVFVEDFAERLNLAYHRNHAHVLPSDNNLRAQLIPERRAQVFEADAIGIKPGDRLSNSLKRFMATANQYVLLSHCESRLGIFNHGPYRCRANEEMLVRGYASTMADFLDHEGEILSKATVELWKEMAGWSRDQMLDAGAMSYFCVAKDLAHVAGVYDPDDWYQIDERAERFKPLLNDEYGRDFLAELLGYVDLPSQQGSPYTMSKWTAQPGDMWWTVPYSVLTDDEYTLTSGPLRPGSTTLPHKQGTYLTTRGRLTLDEYNAACRDFTPTICQEPYRFLDDAWVRGHADTPLADELYRIDQRGSVLDGRGAGVTRAEMDEIRAKRAAT